MEKGRKREMREGKEEIEEEGIDGDEEKSTSIPWGKRPLWRVGSRSGPHNNESICSKMLLCS